MSVFERILRKSAVYAIVFVLGKLTSVILLPIYTRYLSPADYGVLDLLSSAQVFFELLVGVKLTEGMLYFSAQMAKKEPGGERRVVSTALWGALGFGLITAVMGWFGGRLASVMIFGTEQYVGLTRLSIYGVACLPILEMAMGYLRAVDDVVRFAVAGVFRIILVSVLSVTLLAGFELGPAALLWAPLVGTALPAVLVGGWVVRRVGTGFGWGLLWDQIKYSAPLGLSGLAMTFLHYGNRFFLRHYVSMADIGLYGLAQKIGMLVTFVITPFYGYWHSQMYRLVDEPDGRHVYTRLFTYVVLVQTLTTVGVSVFAAPVLALLAAPEFGAAAQMVPYVALAYLLRGVGDQFRSAFSIYKRTDLTAAVTVSGVVISGGLYALLIPKWGVYGALVATIVGFGAMAMLTYILAQRVRRFEFEFGRLGILTVVSAATILPFSLFTPAGIGAQVGLGALAMGLWFAILLAAGFFTGGERAWMLRMVKRAA